MAIYNNQGDFNRVNWDFVRSHHESAAAGRSAEAITLKLWQKPIRCNGRYREMVVWDASWWTAPTCADQLRCETRFECDGFPSGRLPSPDLTSCL